MNLITMFNELWQEFFGIQPTDKMRKVKLRRCRQTLDLSPGYGDLNKGGW